MNGRSFTVPSVTDLKIPRRWVVMHWMQAGAGQSPIPSLRTQDVRDHYDQFAWAYRRYWGDHLHHAFFLTGQDDSAQAQELMLRHCAVRAEVQPGMRVADGGWCPAPTARFSADRGPCSGQGTHH